MIFTQHKGSFFMHSWFFGPLQPQAPCPHPWGLKSPGKLQILPLCYTKSVETMTPDGLGLYNPLKIASTNIRIAEEKTLQDLREVV